MVFNTTIEFKVTPGKRPKKTVDMQLQAWQTQTTRLLGQIPGPVQYPIRWTSERQRRAFFATNGFGRGIPTKRTGKVAKWGVYVDYDAIEEMRSWLFQLQIFLATLDPRKKGRPGAAPGTGELAAITNTIPYQPYVTGYAQQGFHKDTGWIYAPAIVENAVADLQGIMRDTGLL